MIDLLQRNTPGFDPILRFEYRQFGWYFFVLILFDLIVFLWFDCFLNEFILFWLFWLFLFHFERFISWTSLFHSWTPYFFANYRLDYPVSFEMFWFWNQMLLFVQFSRKHYCNSKFDHTKSSLIMFLHGRTCQKHQI